MTIRAAINDELASWRWWLSQIKNRINELTIMHLKYPTLEEVNAADHQQLCFWYRHLPAPGQSKLTAPATEWYEAQQRERKIIARITELINDGGGYKAETSQVAWKR